MSLIALTFSQGDTLSAHLAAWTYIHRNQEELAAWHTKFTRSGFLEKNIPGPEYSSFVTYAENEAKMFGIKEE